MKHLKPQRCELCGRVVPDLTQHHLIPRTRHKNKRVQKQFTRDDMRERILWVCRPCHCQLHAVISEKDLALNYNTRSALLSHPEIRKFISWLAVKPAGFKPKKYQV